MPLTAAEALRVVGLFMIAWAAGYLSMLAPAGLGVRVWRIGNERVQIAEGRCSKSGLLQHPMADGPEIENLMAEGRTFPPDPAFDQNALAAALFKYLEYRFTKGFSGHVTISIKTDWLAMLCRRSQSQRFPVCPHGGRRLHFIGRPTSSEAVI